MVQTNTSMPDNYDGEFIILIFHVRVEKEKVIYVDPMVHTMWKKDKGSTTFTLHVTLIL